MCLSILAHFDVWSFLFCIFFNIQWYKREFFSCSFLQLVLRSSFVLLQIHWSRHGINRSSTWNIKCQVRQRVEWCLGMKVAELACYTWHYSTNFLSPFSSRLCLLLFDCSLFSSTSVKESVHFVLSNTLLFSNSFLLRSYYFIHTRIWECARFRLYRMHTSSTCVPRNYLIANRLFILYTQYT